jgi:hypothetical protein
MTRIKEERDTLLNKRVYEIDNKIDILKGQVQKVELDVGRKSMECIAGWTQPLISYKNLRVLLTVRMICRGNHRHEARANRNDQRELVSLYN